MEKQMIEARLRAQKEYFQKGSTLTYNYRINALKALRAWISCHEAQISEALFADLGKSADEAYMCEIGMTLSELSYMISHLPGLMKPTRVRTPLAQFPARSYKLPSPYGSVLIMSPWNYPFLLTVGPLIDAIAAGNTAIVKPSAYSPATSALIERMIGEVFSPEQVSCVLGGREENSCLLELKFDLIFFTGSQSVGREVLRRAAEHLTPVILELGGKSPCIVDETARIPLAARRIVFGKLLNCGQTCVAPDYILCHSSVKDRLVECIISEIMAQYGASPLANPSYGRIVNEKHFNRLLSLIDRKKLVLGGEYDQDSLRISPAVLDGVSRDDAVMKEEIFGPILPILTYDDKEEIYSALRDTEKPLALYLFTEDKRFASMLTGRLGFGGGCINDTVIHLATTEMGFGGFGESGMGSYHGRDGFAAFTHYKSIVEKSTRLDLPMRYQPYKKANSRLIRMFLS
ncbi:MAG: aldehyde dehydrogenase [Clostridia bacterium]|nr:aldehyde dehydrogenase [Clostridia bacterium]